MVNKIRFSIPYNGDIELVRWAIHTGQVAEVYFSGVGRFDYSASHEVISRYSQQELRAVIKLCADQGVGRNLLMNKNILFFESIKGILDGLNKLNNFGGVTTVTISDPLVVPYIKNKFPQINIQTSVFMHIDTVNKVRECWKMGINTFCLGVSVNRDAIELEKIKKLKKSCPGMSVKLLANHGCYANCFYALRHEDWAELSDFRKESLDENDKYLLGQHINPHRCAYKLINLSDEIKRPFIRPEDVCFYEEHGFADQVKIAYRIDTSSVLRMKLEAYFGRSYRGDLFKLVPSSGLFPRRHRAYILRNELFPKKFIQKTSCCGNCCEKCHYCEDVSLRVFQGR
ncbi:MAG: U32 family peptidase [Candidatus Omnitrophota bacterium]